MLTALEIIAGGGLGVWLLDRMEAAGRRRTRRARASLAASEVAQRLRPYQPAGRALEVLPGGQRKRVS